MVNLTFPNKLRESSAFCLRFEKHGVVRIYTILFLGLLQEEALRQKRLASSRSGLGNEVSSSRSGAGSHDSFSVQATSPDATALTTTYIYAALVVLILGIIIGKWIF